MIVFASLHDLRFLYTYFSFSLLKIIFSVTNFKNYLFYLKSYLRNADLLPHLKFPPKKKKNPKKQSTLVSIVLIVNIQSEFSVSSES